MPRLYSSKQYTAQLLTHSNLKSRISLHVSCLDLFREKRLENTLSTDTFFLATKVLFFTGFPTLQMLINILTLFT